MVYILVGFSTVLCLFFEGLTREYWRYKMLSTGAESTCSHKDVPAFQFSVQDHPMMQTKSTHNWLLYPFGPPKIFRVYSWPWAGPMLLSTLPCCCSLPWQQQLLALASLQKTCHSPRGERNTGVGVRKGMRLWGGCPEFSLRKHLGFPQLLFCCLLMWRSWRWWWT